MSWSDQAALAKLEIQEKKNKALQLSGKLEQKLQTKGAWRKLKKQSENSERQLEDDSDSGDLPLKPADKVNVKRDAGSAICRF